jgi:hypothetical protein
MLSPRFHAMEVCLAEFYSRESIDMQRKRAVDEQTNSIE